MVEAICSCDLKAFENCRPLLWLVALLRDDEYERFVGEWARQAPFDAPYAWQIINLSGGNQGAWRFNAQCGPPSFKPRFHLHPAITPSLLAVTVRVGSESEDAVRLLDYFEAVANTYPVLGNALPAWRVELARRESERKEEFLRGKEREEKERQQREAERAAQEVRFQAVDAQGPAAILRAVKDAEPPTASACPERWAKLPESQLGSLPQDLLEQVVRKLSAERTSRHWHGMSKRIVHFLKSRARSEDRLAYLRQLEQFNLPEKLNAACDSRWSLTYFPAEWAAEARAKFDQIPANLRLRMLSKLRRLHRPGGWRDLRKALMHGEGSNASDCAARA
jgi:hypothetical protein